MFEPGPINAMDLKPHGLVCNFRNFEPHLGGLLGGVVLVAVLKTALTVVVSDGGGLTRTLVLPIGPTGSKLMCGRILAGFLLRCGR